MYFPLNESAHYFLKGVLIRDNNSKNRNDVSEQIRDEPEITVDKTEMSSIPS